jgi:hypothetical protein
VAPARGITAGSSSRISCKKWELASRWQCELEQISFSVEHFVHHVPFYHLSPLLFRIYVCNVMMS